MSSRNVNVLYLTNNAGRASTTVATRGWLQHLMPRGLFPVLVSPISGEFQQWVESKGGRFYRSALPFPTARDAAQFIRSFARILWFARKHRIDLVHCNEQEIYPIGQYVARALRVPVVVSVHFTMERGFCEWAFSGPRAPRTMFFVSAGSRDACRPGVQGIVAESRWRILSNGLDLDHFKPDVELGRRFRDEHNLGDGPVIGVACALRPRKQLEHLFQAAAKIDDSRLRVVVAGGPVGGDERYADELLRNARAALGNRFVAVGHLEELRGFYNSLDVFVNTSQEEACSISVSESLACGTPLVAYPSKSVDGQILPDGGEVVDQDDVAALTATLQRWLDDPAALHSRRIGARRTAEAKFDIRTLSRELWREYEQILAV
jgi:glycosyltransferase involved in cell wall biosynthesis